MTDRFAGLTLQRRAGRRKSTPASPSSPTFHRRQMLSQDITLPVFSPADKYSSSGTASDGSPMIDLTVPSPTFDLIVLASPSIDSSSNSRETHRPNPPPARGSDDLSKNRPKFTSEPGRPATSSAATGTSRPNHFRTAVPFESTTSNSSSPPLGSQRSSGDASRQSTSREAQDEGSLQRAATFWAQYDENTASRGMSSGKKSRFNLLSPMSLFARRRSSQSTGKADDNSHHVPPIPDNIETSIRGSIVHDFSAPRVRGSPRPGFVPSPSYPRRPSDLASPTSDSNTGTPHSQHSPMFTEHFSEEQRLVRPADTAYLHGQNLQLPTSQSLPTFAKKLPLILPDQNLRPSWNSSSAINSTDTDEVRIVPPEPGVPPPSPPRRTLSPILSTPQGSLMPKHNASTSSRFSFLGQQDSIAQEKLMEEKHKEHASKNPIAPRLSVVSIEDVDAYADYDGFEDDDGFDTGEITIRDIDLPSSQIEQRNFPIITVDDEDDEDDYGFNENNNDHDDHETSDLGTDYIQFRDIDLPRITTNTQPHPDSEDGYAPPEDATGLEDQYLTTGRQSQRQSLQAFHFTPLSLSFSPTTTQHTSQSTPCDIEGFPIGKARTQSDMLETGPHIRNSTEQSPDSIFFEGLGISTEQPDDCIVDHMVPAKPSFDDNDLYFDDGEFENEFSVDNGHKHFDEEALDDATQIRDIPAENERRYEEALQHTSLKGTATAPSQQFYIDSLLRAESPSAAFAMAQDTRQPGLTEDNLAAYHDALAMAANRAAADGKFSRNVSFGQVADDVTDSPFYNVAPILSSGGSHYSNNIEHSGFSDDDAFGFDDDMDDEAMIAAANAEALENDDDGFYGQEFGFYARTYGKEPTDLNTGGYFAPHGSNGIKRSHSGKNNFQEPSLTPITERSEWSTRNSVVSVYQGPTGGPPLQSPGIAQLLERGSPIVEDEMSLEMLKKLRSRTFGGSSSSVNSLADRHHVHSSPLAQSSGFNGQSASDVNGRMSSPAPQRNGMSIAESEDEEDESAKLTLTQNTPHKKSSLPARDASHSSSEHIASSPISRRANHSRNSSGGESVSYAMDEGGRWVLERRRTGDDGELEWVGREYLAGARI